MKLCITGGGTGGHLMIAEALAEAATAEGHEVIFIGSTSGQDRKYFEMHSHFSHVYFLETTGVVNQKGFKKVEALYKIFKAFLMARKFLKMHKIQATYSVGGFSAAPASFASFSNCTPLFVHEQNAVDGKLNAFLKQFSRRFISAYDKNSAVKGYPVKDVFYKNARVRSELKTIIFLGGSHGARTINNLALSIAEKLTKRGIKIIHQAGENDYERVKKEYEEKGIHVELYAFTKNMALLITHADLAVSRAGASTLWELTSNGCPTFYIPYPYAAGDHQYYNAKFIVDKSIGWCQREGEDLEDKFLEILDAELKYKSQGLLKYTNKDVAKKMIVDVQKSVCD